MASFGDTIPYVNMQVDTGAQCHGESSMRIGVGAIVDVNGERRCWILVEVARRERCGFGLQLQLQLQVSTVVVELVQPKR